MDKDVEEKLSKLSKLIHIIIPALGLYLVLGMFAYSLIEKWSLFDSLYFSVITIATVGYGDLYPHTVMGKIFTMFYVFIGIGLFVFVANSFLQYRALKGVDKRQKKKSSKKSN